MNQLFSGEKFDKAVKLRSDWKRALRSGEYEQVVGKLVQSSTYGPDKYCCLGVACEINSQLGVVRYDLGAYIMGHDYRDLTLPEELRKALALSEEDQSILVALNDHGANFGLIAEAISAMKYWED